jgi:enamine deaminase RidA (YjgF/YER057c/UK114 family)
VSRRSADQRAEELFLDLPIPAKTPGAVVHVRRCGDLAWVGPALPICDGLVAYAGRVGLEQRLDQGQAAARMAMEQALGMIKAQLGSLGKVKDIIHLTGHVAAGPDFREHLQVLDPAGQLLIDIYGSASGKHARSAFGVASLPQNACVMLELIVRV